MTLWLCGSPSPAAMLNSKFKLKSKYFLSIEDTWKYHLQNDNHYVTNFSSLAIQEVVKITISSAASNKNSIKMTTF